MDVSSLMTRDVASCEARDTLNRAAEVMWTRDVGCVPIIDGNHHVVGMLTDRDVCMAAYIQGKRLGDIPVGLAMSRDVATCRPQDGIVRAESLMQDRQIRRLPVTDPEGRLVGILSLSDIARASARNRSADVGPAAVSATLAAVSEPRHVAPPA